jgi:chaperone required for assembly of F1-ATPase
MKKISNKTLKYLANDGLVYPDNKDELYKEQEDLYKQLGLTEEQLDQINLCPDEFWYYTNDLVFQLANELLEEREKKYDSLIEPIDDMIRELQFLKKKIKNNFK